MVKVLSLFAFWFLCPLWAGVHEIQSLKEVLPYVTPETFLIFDLDNTLMEPTQSFGSDQWFEAKVAQKRKQGMSEEEAVPEILKTWVRIQKVTLVRPVEEITALVFAQARSHAKMVMALTARPVDLAETTGAQLKGMGIDFSTSAPVPTPMEMNVQNGRSTYRRGIFFLGENKNKGIGLLRFLEETKLQPKRIVFVDDKERHVKALEASLKDSKIAYEGLRYAGADAHVKAFRMDVAEEEAKRFGDLIK